ncbi:Flowering time control protein FCA [Camellia lanceoleosa]|uniref:Flowering time control protein FCA n=1 Tax=Camellia lanceoleosa TaxID=1840588 RepID=A0ACC0FVD1_9ERIC|nr:Flowering time control protein FCA [Camellia lanceoleosa]
MAMAAINGLSGIYTMKGCDQPLTVRFFDPKRPRVESRGVALHLGAQVLVLDSNHRDLGGLQTMNSLVAYLNSLGIGQKLKSLFLGNNKLTGILPAQKSTPLLNIFPSFKDLSEKKKKKTSTTVAPKFPRKLAAFWAAKWVNFIQHPLSYHQQ